MFMAYFNTFPDVHHSSANKYNFYVLELLAEFSYEIEIFKIFDIKKTNCMRFFVKYS